jgi:hypothetical protein
MRTRIRILAPTYANDSEGYKNPSYANIYPDDRTIRCKWVSAFGVEAVQAQSLGLKDTATLTMRYDPRIRGDCIVQCGEGKDKKLYEIISPPNDVGDMHRIMELRVKRREKAL